MMNTLSYGSVCSGVEAASVAWDNIGFTPSWFSEIDDFPSAVLAYRWPGVANLGDMTLIGNMIISGEVEAPDILVGGTPCQSFSVAGLRGGMSDSRGQLTIAYIQLANIIDEVRIKNGKQPCIIIWENVPGVLSSKDNAFGSFLAGLAGERENLQPTRGGVSKWSNAGVVLGPKRKIAWRILDAQHFGVPQRRRRVFLVASARNGFEPHEVLFESESLHGDITPSARTQKNITKNVKSCTGVSDKTRRGLASGKNVVSTLMANAGTKLWLGNQEAFSGDYFILEPITISGNMIGREAASGGNGKGFDTTGMGYTLTTNDRHAVAYSFDSLGSNSMKSKNPNSGCREVTISKTLDTMYPCPSKNQGGLAIVHKEPNFVVRRLTPLECERLQGFPDNHTQVPFKGKSVEDCPDSPRYTAMGNSMAVPVMRWLGERVHAEVFRL